MLSFNPIFFPFVTPLNWCVRSVNKKQYRLFAFWDKREEGETLVVSTHGILKKTSKIPKKEIAKAEKIREQYFNDDKN